MPAKVTIPLSYYHQKIKPELIKGSTCLTGIRPKHREWMRPDDTLRDMNYGFRRPASHLSLAKGNRMRPKKVTLLILEEDEFYSGKTNPECLNPNPRKELYLVVKYPQNTAYVRSTYDRMTTHREWGTSLPYRLLQAAVLFALPPTITLETL